MAFEMSPSSEKELLSVPFSTRDVVVYSETINCSDIHAGNVDQGRDDKRRGRYKETFAGRFKKRLEYFRNSF